MEDDTAVVCFKMATLEVIYKTSSLLVECLRDRRWIARYVGIIGDTGDLNRDFCGGNANGEWTVKMRQLVVGRGVTRLAAFSKWTSKAFCLTGLVLQQTTTRQVIAYGKTLNKYNWEVMRLIAMTDRKYELHFNWNPSTGWLLNIL